MFKATYRQNQSLPLSAIGIAAQHAIWQNCTDIKNYMFVNDTESSDVSTPVSKHIFYLLEQAGWGGAEFPNHKVGSFRQHANDEGGRVVAWLRRAEEYAVNLLLAGKVNWTLRNVGDWFRQHYLSEFDLTEMIREATIHDAFKASDGSLWPSERTCYRHQLCVSCELNPYACANNPFFANGEPICEKWTPIQS